jgi:chromosomal replication initiation ATPase DnaA
MEAIASDVIQQVATIYGVSANDVLSRKRDRIFADARTVIFYALCELHKVSYKQAGRLMSRTHADVIYHVAKAHDWISNPKLNMDGAVAILEMECRMRHIFA